MFNIGGAEVLVILLVALLVLGPDKLPEAARKAGQAMSELRKMSAGFRREMKEALDETDDRPARQRPTRHEAPPANARPIGEGATPAAELADPDRDRIPTDPSGNGGGGANGEHPVDGDASVSHTELPQSATPGDRPSAADAHRPDRGP